MVCETVNMILGIHYIFSQLSLVKCNRDKVIAQSRLDDIIEVRMYM